MQLRVIKNVRHIGLSGNEAPDEFTDADFDEAYGELVTAELKCSSVLLDAIGRLTDDAEANRTQAVLTMPDDAMRANVHQLLVTLLNTPNAEVRAMCAQELLERVAAVVAIDVEQAEKNRLENEEIERYLDGLERA